MTNYPNDPNQPGGYGQQPNNGSGDGSGNPQYGNPQYNSPQYGAPQGGGDQQYGAQPYGAPQYGAPQQGGNPYGAQVPAEHDKSTLILILGIVSLVFCGLFTGIPAIIMGRQALAQIDASNGMLGGRGKVKTGFICGIIGTAWTLLVIVIRLTS